MTLVAGADQKLNQINIPDPKRIRFDAYNDSYEEFIQKIRDELKHSDAHGIPVLKPQRRETPENVEWLDILLVAGEHGLTVRLQQSNLYVRGYRRSSTNYFWEFADTHLITGSRNLSFSGGYVKCDSIEKKADVRREDLILGYNSLANAISRLNKLESPNDNLKLAAGHLLIIVQMTSEAARIKTISDHIKSDYWTDDGGVMIDGRMVSLEKCWGDLSTAVRQLTVTNPTPLTELPNIPATNPTKVHTLGQARDALGILLIERGTEGAMAMNADCGRCLMNLEYVLISNNDVRDPGKLYGTVRVDDGWFTHTFYDRSTGYYEDAGPGGFATLADSSYPYAVSGADSFIISVDLSGHYDNIFPEPWDVINYQIAQGEIVWDVFGESATFENYDKHLQQTVKGENGAVTVGYSVMSNALGVTIQVLLVNGDGEDPAEVCGTLSASQVLGGSAGSTPISLFEKPSLGYVKVRKGQPIPLTRTIIAAAMSSKLTITADLWDHDYFSPNDAIAQGSVDFTVQPGTQRQFIYGDNGQVEVIITCH